MFSNVQNLENTGLQKIACDKSGENKDSILVCDTQGIVLKFSKDALLGTENPSAHEIVDSTSAAIAWNNSICIGYSTSDYIYGTDKKLVGKFGENLEKASDLLEFQFRVTTIDMNEDYLVAASSDYAVKCLDFKSRSDIRKCTLEGEPLCIQIDPEGKYAAVSSVNGVISLIDMSSFEIFRVIKNAFKRFETIDVSKPVIQISWSKNGKHLFVPSNGCVKAYSRDIWVETESFTFPQHHDVIFSTTTVSICGKYLASSSLDNNIVVWNIETGNVFNSAKYTRNLPVQPVITSLEFSPFSNDLVVADSNKGICMYHAFETLPSIGNKTKSMSANDILNSAENDSDDDDDSIVLGRRNNRVNDLFGEHDIDDEASNNSNDISVIKQKYGFANPSGHPDLEEFGFNIGEPAPVSTPPEPLQNGNEFTKPYPDDYEYSYASRKRTLIPERFVSASSPFDMSQRYLKYNRYGMIRSYENEQSKISSIDIEFHDKSVHADINIDNFDSNYKLGDISLKIVVLASLESKKKEKEIDKSIERDLEVDEIGTGRKGTSVLLAIPISSFDSQKWSVTLPRGDGVIDVAVSDQLVFAVTITRNIRVFTLFGSQRHIISHPAPVLTTACFSDKLAIANVMGAEFFEADCKKTSQWRVEVSEYMLSNKDWYRYPKSTRSSGILHKVELPVKAGAQLNWLNYTSKGKLVCMDSEYNVNVLCSAGIWIPIFSGSSILRGPSDGIFPIGAVEGGKSNEFRYVYCRGTKHPLICGINAPTTVKWTMPYCNVDSEKTKTEEDLFSKEMALCDAVSDGDLKAIDLLERHQLVAITKLFALAIKCESMGRAAELAELVSSERGIQNLCNYASKNKKTLLAEKVAEIGRNKLEKNEKVVEDMIRPSKHIMFGAKKKAVVVQEEKEEERGNFDIKEEQESINIGSQAFNDSMAVIAPIERIATNPFKKSNVESNQSGSVFDHLEKISNDRKRTRKEEVDATATRKQAKLSLGTVKKTNKTNMGVEDKENDVVPDTEKCKTPYDLWLEASEVTLRESYDGEDVDFSKFCIKAFRALSSEEKSEWKSKAQKIVRN